MNRRSFLHRALASIGAIVAPFVRKAIASRGWEQCRTATITGLQPGALHYPIKVTGKPIGGEAAHEWVQAYAVAITANSWIK